MGLYSPERGDLSNTRYWTIVIILAFAAMSVAGQTTPSAQPLTPLEAQEKPTLPAVEEKKTEDNASVDVDIQRRFDELRNELRRELLDDRAETINWWLAVTAIFLTFFGIVVVLGGYFGFGRFREIEAEAKKYAEEARKLVEEINEQKKRAEENLAYLTRMVEQRSRLLLNTEDLAPDDAPLSILLDQGQRESDTAQEAEEAVREVRRNPEASSLARAIADAVSLQRAGRIEEAIEKWRSIANVAEGSDNDLAARAWLSVGYLLYERGGEDAGEQ